MAFNFITNPPLRFFNKRSFPTKNLGKMSKMNRDFLKEAIADAKAVKESAIANAKVALEEAFSPQVQAMFASKLEEMEKDEMKEAYDDVDEAKDDDAKKMEEKMSDPDMRHGEDEGGKPEAGALKATEKDREIEEGYPKYEEDDKDSKMEEDMDLDEILAELEKDEVKEDARTDAEQEGYKDGFEDAKDDIEKELKKMKVSEEEINEDERTDAEEEGYKDGMKDEKEDMEDEEIDLEDMSEGDLKKFIEDVIEDMVNAGEIEAGESFEDDVDVDVEADGDVNIEDDEMTSVDMAMEAKKDMDEEMKKDVDEAKDEKMDEMKKDLDEAMETIATLRSELNEINLLNAKLLYTNKVFRGKNLTESQKVKVLGAFDKAETVKEVKLVFETIDGAVKAKATNKSISEGIRAKGSASNLSATPKVTKKQPIVESDEMVSRFKKLAGII
jgi:hypothetical protein